MPVNREQDSAEARHLLYSLLGDLPDMESSPVVRVVDVNEHAGLRIETLVLDLNGIEAVPAHFVRPSGSARRLPVVLYNHAHGGDYELGKDELLRGRPALQEPPYGFALAGAGYAALCIDTWLFGERRGRTESELFKQMLWQGQVLWGMMIYDSLRAVDYLATREDVDANRIGTLGLSMGSTMAWWIAALDTRIKVCVDLCCLTDYEALIAARGLDGHGIYYYVPNLLKHFSTSDINALIAPRPHLALAGNYDPLTPPEGLSRIDNDLRTVYAEADAADAWKMIRYETGHFETAHMRAEVMTYLDTWL
jgi:dienelactone hydrolase